MDELKPKCDFIHCFAGMGVAGTGRCFLGGDPQNPNCPKFKDEGEALKEWEEEEKSHQPESEGERK